VSAGEYEYEAIEGLPGELPAGERLLWQGKPGWWPLTRQALRFTPVAVYFALLALWEGSGVWTAQHSWAAVAHAMALPLTLGAFALLLLGTIGWAAAHATVYSITSRRVVIRHGIALPMSLNLPFQHILAADLKLRAAGGGDLALTLPRSQRVGYLLNWPHVRPGHYLQPQPSLRGIADARAVAELLGAALRARLAEPASSLPAVHTDVGSQPVTGVPGVVKSPGARAPGTPNSVAA
jgi:hypothetical protein